MPIADREVHLRRINGSEAKGEDEVLHRAKDGSQRDSEKARAYLILHKVRGLPAFDIAERCGMCKEPCQPQCGLWPGCQKEEWWIIPTSGHTAHPYWTTKIDEWDFFEYSGAEKALKEMPADLPDHYPNDVGTAPTVNVMTYVSKLLPKFHRRF